MRIWLLFVLAGVLPAQETPQQLLARAQADLTAGRYAAVIKEAGEAAALFRKLGDLTGEGRALTGAGLAYLYSGDYPNALQSFNQALEIARRTHDTSNEIVRLNNIGNVLYFQGRYAGSFDRYHEALRLVNTHPNEQWSTARRTLTNANTAILYQTLGQYERALTLYSDLINAPQALPPAEHAQLLSNVGALRRRLGDPRKALDTYREAQALYRKAAHPDGEIAVLNNIGIVQAMDLSEYEAAVTTFTEALRLAEGLGDRPLIVHAHLYRGETFYRAGRFSESSVDFQAALDNATALGEKEESWKALYGLGRIASHSGNKVESDELLKRAVALIESLRAGLHQPSLRSEFLADKRDVYDLLLEHATDPNEIFRLMEQSRARTLQDRVPSGAADTLAEVTQSLPAGSALLEYWIGPASAAVLWISGTDRGIRRMVLTPDDVKDLADLPAILADSARRDWRQTASRVAQKLLTDIPALQRPDLRRLVIIPDDAIERIPFEALPLDGSHLVIERFSISYLPSAALLSTHRTLAATRWPWQPGVLAFADPAPGTADAGAQLAQPRAWPRLPEAAREVNGIARLLPGTSAVYIGPDARKALLTQDLDVPVIHLATHAFADIQNPERSFILFAPANPSQRFDYLFLREIAALSLSKVELVTASACETEVGKFVRGEGVQSFSRAFLAAGARSVVTSLWSVRDRTTADMMLRFYSHLAGSRSKADALREAKLDMLRQPASAHPANWGPFVLNGDSDSALPGVVSWNWFVVPPLALLFVVLVVKKRAGKA